MKYLDLTLPTPQENLACDEALLDLCEEGLNDEILRFWESPHYFVVLGYSNQIQSEVRVDDSNVVPILRRCSGGGTVLQGPGCLNYSLILNILKSPDLQSVTSTNEYIMNAQRLALQPLLNDKVAVKGTTDLALGDLKFSGNAQRRKRQAVLFHGTFLYQFDVPKVEAHLPFPSKQPDYRKDRLHQDFLRNLPLSADDIKAALRKYWKAQSVFKKVPHEKIADLVRMQYSREEWNRKF
jgi:lipoate---protein ligase